VTNATVQRWVLQAVLASLRPLVGLLVKHGVTYPALASALKSEFVAAAGQEIQRQGMKPTDSAVTLLSGVHRKDIRALSRPKALAPLPSTAQSAHGLIGEVVARWLHDRAWRAPKRAGAPANEALGEPAVLPRARASAGASAGVPARIAASASVSPSLSAGRVAAGRRKQPSPTFDALVASISQDVRPRAILDEMLRLGIARETPEGIALEHEGLAPHQGLDAMCEVMAMNLHDHAAAAVANITKDHHLLEQSIYVDDITAESAQLLHDAAKRAWRQAFETMMDTANERLAYDAQHASPQARSERARFGVYYFHAPDGAATADPASRKTSS
jgi:hypothetical protein